MKWWGQLVDFWERWRKEKEERQKRHEKTTHFSIGGSPILRIIRMYYTGKSTVGKLYFDNEFQCHTLEDTIRDPNKDGKLTADEKVYGKTAIPAGTYEVVISYSNKFKKKLPLLMNVPHFTGIRIHSGNIPEHTLGCILVGSYAEDQPDVVLDSRSAFSLLMPKIENALTMRKVFIDIVGGPTA